MAIQPGRRLGPYEILSTIGAGGMGEVHRARDTRLDRTVALKVLHAHLADQPGLRERFGRAMWHRNGRELFYRSGTRMLAVDIATQPSFRAGRPRVLFDRPYVAIQLPQTFPYYDVSPDGQRFLMVKEGERADAPPIQVIVNWTEDLRRRQSVSAR